MPDESCAKFLPLPLHNTYSANLVVYLTATTLQMTITT